MLIYSWKGRPPVADDTAGRAWAVLEPGADWTEVSYGEVTATGSLIRNKSIEEAFPNVPPLPSGIAGRHRRPEHYFFHILSRHRLKIDGTGQVFSHKAHADEHGQFIAKDLRTAGLKEVLILVASDSGEILYRIEV